MLFPRRSRYSPLTTMEFCPKNSIMAVHLFVCFPLTRVLEVDGAEGLLHVLRLTLWGLSGLGFGASASEVKGPQTDA